MQKNGKSVTPVLLTGTPVTVQQQLQFRVEVAYERTTSGAAVYGGSFYAADATRAEALARNFVVKYLRPKRITDVLVQPLAAGATTNLS